VGLAGEELPGEGVPDEVAAGEVAGKRPGGRKKGIGLERSHSKTEAADAEEEEVCELLLA